MTILWIILGAIIVAVLYVVMEIRRVNTPTTGPKINPDDRPGMALLVIDMQSDFTSIPAWDEAILASAISHIKADSDQARQSGIPVIAIRQVFKGWLATTLNGWFNQGRGNAGSSGIAVDPRLELFADAEFEKSVGDAFSSSEFERFLEENQIGTLILTGLDGCYCVNTTAQGALNRGYRVQIDPAAVLAADPTKWAGVKESLATAGAAFRGSPG